MLEASTTPGLFVMGADKFPFWPEPFEYNFCTYNQKKS